MTTIGPDGIPIEWTAIYYRDHCPCAEECESAEEAISLLQYGEDNGALTTVAVLDPDGRIVHSSILDRDPAAKVAAALRDLANVWRGKENMPGYPSVLRRRGITGQS